MKRLAMLLLLMLPLTACGSGKKPSAGVPTAQRSSSIVSSASSSAAVTTVPRCSELVGKPAAQVIDPTRGPQCITGTSVASDHTGWGKLDCVDVKTGAKLTVYHWMSQDPAAPDTAEYVARSDGNVTVLGSIASTAHPARTLTIFVAAGCV